MKFLLGAAALMVLQAGYLLLCRVLAVRRNRLPYQSDFHTRRGAAYQNIFTLLEENPDEVADSVGYERVLSKIQAVRRWAATQDRLTKRAYVISARDVLQRARGAYVNNQRARQMHLMRHVMPAPPKNLLDAGALLASQVEASMPTVQPPRNSSEKLAPDDHPTIQ
ncbi:MAG: hypothetical protein KGO96_10545 [Elusimicrobia bacterium]|nr:hypothetical protein [Elusimicrobiota bacterium]